MNRECFEQMIKDLDLVEIIIDAIAGHGAYSSGQMYFQVYTDAIKCNDRFVTFLEVNASFDTSDRKFDYLMIPYERIIGVGTR